MALSAAEINIPGVAQRARERAGEKFQNPPRLDNGKSSTDTPAPAVAPPPGFETLGPAFASLVEPHLKNVRVDVDAIVQKVCALMPKTQKLEVKTATGEFKPLGMVHRAFKRLVKMVARSGSHGTGRWMMIVGMAGTGKTYTAGLVATALAEMIGRPVPFYPISLGPHTAESALKGFIDASGRCVLTALRQAWTHGGLVLFDEIDATNAGVMTSLNALLTASELIWPDGERVPRHEDFYAIAAANTYGTGSTHLYCGRNQLDAATLDRFSGLAYDPDPEFELALAQSYAARYREGFEGTVTKWTRHVQKLRESADRQGMKVLIGQRAIIAGAVALADGDTWEEAEMSEIWFRINHQDRITILTGAGLPLPK